MVLRKNIQFQLLLVGFLLISFSVSSLSKSFSTKVSKEIGIKNTFENALEDFNFNAHSNLYPQDTTLTLKQLDSLRQDSIKLGLIEIDSSMYDSTARIKHFKYVRKDKKFLTFNQERVPSLFARPSQRNLKRTVELDSTGNYVIIREFIANHEIKFPLKIPLDDYIKLKLNQTERDTWAALGYQYKLEESKDDLGQLFSDLTNIEIPLPSVGFLSIFGPPKISLRINGAVDIHGAWRSETTEGVTASLLGNTRNEPDFKQQVQINVNGTIGDKLTISADWNTERTFEYENQLKLHYKGYEDEIIQSIEAGNVSLQTSPLVGGGEALFGIKAFFKFGPFSLTALASQKKSEVEEVSVSGGSQSNTFEVHAYEYSQNHYFVDQVYYDRDLKLFERYYGSPSPPSAGEYRIKEIEVWKTTSGKLDISTQRRANAYMELSPRSAIGEPQPYDESLRNTAVDTKPGLTLINDRFVQMVDGVDYDYNPDAGIISFRTQISDEDAIAVAFRTEGPTGETDLYTGEFLKEVVDDTSKVMVLKLVKPKRLQPGGDFEQAWNLQLKNIYPIGGRDVKKEGFSFDIEFEIPGQEPVNNLEGENFLEQFGLDVTDESGAGGPDGAFDWDPGRTILPVTGEIIFPVLEPFGNDFPEIYDQELAYQSVYDTTVTFAKQDNAKDKFILIGEYSADASSVYNIGFNVVENSVKVSLNGRTLTEGSDYIVDYNIGQVIIRNEDALVTGANLKISYEKNDLFQLASKTLLGLRGIYDFSEKTKLGFSFLNLNQTTLSDKVRIGEEPLNNSIFGVDFQTALDLPFLTKGLGNLISTREMSSITLKGEFAYMSPDPNTKKSKIDSDNGQSIAYIDDFEGAKRTIPIGVSYTGWRDISPPNQLPGFEGFSPSELMPYKAKSYWYNILPSDVTVDEIWGDRKSVGRNNDQVTALDFYYDPSRRGAYNYQPNLSNKFQNWAGMMKPLSSTASNLVEENIEFIEFWLKLRDAPTDAKLIIDLGQISEDIIANNVLDQEDKNQNDRLDDGEDVGLDGLKTTEELNIYGDVDGTGDPSGDNFKFSLGSADYSTINGTEGNGKLSDSGLLPDTEDMNKNFTLDKVNSYFRYEIPLDTVRSRNEFISGGGDNDGWYQFRIPIKEAIDSIGNPSLTIVEVIRLLVTGVDKPIHIRLAELNLVGNQWQKLLEPGRVEDDDTTLIVSTINYEDNPEYNSPPGVTRERDKTQTEYEVFKNEQSLQLKINDLEDGDYREIVKYLYRPLDVFSYKQMKLFIHGELNSNPGSISYFGDENDYGAEVYFRFGTDTANFYEFRQPVRAGWNEISILFDELTAIKQKRLSEEINQLFIDDRGGYSYGVKGLPTLTKINYFQFGIKNPKDKGELNERVSGELWVNELRVLGADDTPGWAYSGSSQIKFADLLSVNINASQTDPYFHKLNQRFGSRVDSRKWSGSANLNVLKLLPWNLKGSNFNVSYTHSESVSKPKYIPGTDIEVNQAVEQEKEKLISQGVDKTEVEKLAEEIRTETQSLNTSDTWSISSIRFKLPSKSWYVQDIINNLQFSYNFNKTYSRSPSSVFNKSWVWNGSGKYTLNFSKDNYLFLANIPLIGGFFEFFEDYKNVKLYFTPQSFNTGISASRRESSNLTRTTDAQIKTQRDFTSKRNLGFNWKITEGGLFNLTLNYSVNASSSYAHLLEKNDVTRPESEIWKDILYGSIFGRDFSYSQNFDLKTNPALPTLWNIRKYLNLNLGYSVNYRWSNNFKQEDLGRSVGWSNNLRASLTLRWKSLTAPLFSEEPVRSTTTRRSTRNTRGRGRNKVVNVDEALDKANEVKTNPKSSIKKDSTVVEEGEPVFSKALSYLKAGAKWLLFDYENFNFNFNQSNSSSSSGVKATGTGFSNFWWQNNDITNGPSRSYMLGLSTDAGPRAANGNLSDSYTQKNSIDFKTARDLWEGAKINLTWKVGWGMNKTTRITTDENGEVFLSDVTTNGNLNRSFMYIPLPINDVGITKVNELYLKNGDIADAFSEGFESIPIISKLPILKDVTKYIPRANWRIDWRGLEKISFLEGLARTISLNHAYSSTYTEGWKIDPDGNKQVQTQRINYGFTPLAGINITFDKMWGGNLTGSIKYSTKNSFDLGITTKNITESFSKDINFTASYSKSGFSLPLFGLDFKNDIEMSLSYTQAQNSVVIYEMGENFSENGKPQDGTNRVIIEPRVKYTLSSKVTLSIFYKRTTVEPEGASNIPATTTNEAGLDVHISIQ